MRIELTDIDGPLIIEPEVFADQRGHFFEQFHVNRYRQIGLRGPFVQDNCAYSHHGVIRGLHYQVAEHAQGKLASVVYGRVLDVAVDIRFGSPTFGEHIAVELSSDNQRQLWVPPGFAHGVSVLSDVAVLSYKCTAYFNASHQRAIRYDDPDLQIDWQVGAPVVTEKDAGAGYFRAIERDFVYDGALRHHLAGA
ncbi:MAG: dTDP-4-dehydrorhamnose 3,5-epimerase [Pseudomonadota bacterium]